MNEICDDDRFELIAKAKQKLLNDTNISSRVDELTVLDSILFRCWQMGWLDPERTCKNIDDEFPYFKCSECGCNAVVGYESSGDGLPNYCPNCGAKVMKP